MLLLLGASTYHSGIDIGAPEGAKVVSSFSGTVTYAGFKGAGGYTIVVENSSFSASYCHLSPTFLVSLGDYVMKGEAIGTVGPKNVYGVPNNHYIDDNGNPTNGATTGSHLHFTLKEKNILVNPLDYISSS